MKVMEMRGKCPHCHTESFNKQAKENERLKWCSGKWQVMQGFSAHAMDVGEGKGCVASIPSAWVAVAVNVSCNNGASKSESF